MRNCSPPSCSEIVHLASSQPSHFPAHLWTVLTLRLSPPQPLLPAATGCSSTTPSEPTALGTGISQQGQEVSRFTPCAGKATRCWRPSLLEEEGNLPALLQNPGTEKREQGVRGSLTPLCPNPLPSSRHSRMQQASTEDEDAVPSVDLPWERTSRRSPSLLAGFPGTEAQGERDWAGMYRLGMSQVKRKSQRMEGREMPLWRQTGTARGRHRWTKEMTGRKNMQDARGKNMEGQKKNKRKVILQDKKNSNEEKQEKKKALWDRF